MNEIVWVRVEIAQGSPAVHHDRVTVQQRHGAYCTVVAMIREVPLIDCLILWTVTSWL